VHHTIAALHRLTHRSEIGDVPRDPIDLEAGEISEVLLRQMKDSDLFTAGNQGSDDVRAHEPRAARDEDSPHFSMIYGKLRESASGIWPVAAWLPGLVRMKVRGVFFMAMQGVQGQVDAAKLREISDWFSQVQAQPTRTEGQKKIVDIFSKAGISSADQIAKGENVGKLLEQTAAKLDDLVQMTRSCPAGKMNPQAQNAGKAE
jgi:hypothetical protein